MANNIKKHTDDELVALFINGNQSAFTEIMARYKTLVYNAVKKATNNNEEINDICQEVFTKVFISIKDGNYSSKGKFANWISVIASRAAIDFNRIKKIQTIEIDESNKEHNNPETEHIIPSDSYQEPTIDTDEYDPKIDDMIMQLEQILNNAPIQYRQMLKMKIYDDLSLKEIAEIQNKPIGTVSSDIHYAKIWVRKRYNEINNIDEE